MTAEDVVSDPRSTLDQYAIGSKGSASVWRLCPGGRCLRPKYAVALSTDGFRTRTVLDLPVQRYIRLQGVSGGRFVVMGHERNVWLADADGSTTPIRWEKQETPVADSEVPLMWGDLFGVDLASARMHPVSTPGRLGLFWQVGQQFRGVRYYSHGTSTYLVSADRGATWGEAELSRARGALWMPVEGGRAPALVEGADGATLFPFVASWRQSNGGFQPTDGPAHPTAYVSCAHRLRDGRLLVCVDGWSDHSKQPGFWVSTDRSWSDLEHVVPGAPFDDERPFQPVVVGERDSEQGLTLVVRDPETGGAYATRDEGRHFHEVRAR